MASRILLLRSALRRSTAPSSSPSPIRQISSFRSLLASPDSGSPFAGAPHFLRRTYITGETVTAPYSSEGEEDAASVHAQSLAPPEEVMQKSDGSDEEVEVDSAGKVVANSEMPEGGGKVRDRKYVNLRNLLNRVQKLEKEMKLLKEKANFSRVGSQGGSLSSGEIGGGGESLTEKKSPALGDGDGDRVVNLSEEKLALLERLREDELLDGAGNLWEDGKMVPERLRILHIQHILRSASEKFGIKHQEIAQWLPGSDLKKVAQFGCPSLQKKSIFAAKQLRSFFRIQEDVVCRGCKLKSACSYTGRAFPKVNKLNLSDAMRVLMAYSFYESPPEIVITSEIEESIAKLLKKIVNFSK